MFLDTTMSLVNFTCVLAFLTIKLPAIIFKGNGAVIALSREMTSRAKRCKHFLLAISWIREQVAAGLIQLQQIPDKEIVLTFFRRLSLA